MEPTAEHLQLWFCFNLCSWSLFSTVAIQKTQERKKGVFLVIKDTMLKLLQFKKKLLYSFLITLALESIK